MKILEKISKYCTQNNIKLVLTGVPHYQQCIFNENGKRVWSIRPHQGIKKIAQENGVVYLDSIGFLTSYVKNNKQADYYYKDDMHLNSRGYILWAKAHIRKITEVKERLLPDFVYPKLNNLKNIR